MRASEMSGRPGWAREVARELKKRTFSGQIFSGRKRSFAFIVYEPTEIMRIYGLKPELPSVLYFEEGGVVKGSPEDGPIQSIEDRDFQIFRILDPRVVLDHLEIRSRTEKTVEGDYSLTFLEMPNQDLLRKSESGGRRVAFKLGRDSLPKKMTQEEPLFDAPPVTVKFEY
jgi:hypothetical protein